MQWFVNLIERVYVITYKKKKKNSLLALTLFLYDLTSSPFQSWNHDKFVILWKLHPWKSFTSNLIFIFIFIFF